MQIAQESHSEESDQELIQRYKNSKDLAIIGLLYKRYSHLVFGVSLKYLKNSEESKDAVMQVFEKLISSLLKHDISHFKSWLHVTTRNHCLMELRQRKLKGEREGFEKFSEDNMEYSLSVHPINERPVDEDLDLMKKCMDQLPENQRKCMHQFYLDDCSYKEVSLNLGFEMKKVKSYIQNGKRNVKNCIEKNRE